MSVWTALTTLPGDIKVKGTITVDERTGFTSLPEGLDWSSLRLRVARLRKDRSNPRELALLERLQAALEAHKPIPKPPQVGRVIGIRRKA